MSNTPALDLQIEELQKARDILVNKPQSELKRGQFFDPNETSELTGHERFLIIQALTEAIDIVSFQAKMSGLASNLRFNSGFDYASD